VTQYGLLSKRQHGFLLNIFVTAGTYRMSFNTELVYALSAKLYTVIPTYFSELCWIFPQALDNFVYHIL